MMTGDKRRYKKEEQGEKEKRKLGGVTKCAIK